MVLLRWFVTGLYFAILTQIEIAKLLFWNRLLRLELFVSVLAESMKKVLTGLGAVLLGNLSGSESSLFPVRETPQVSALLKVAGPPQGRTERPSGNFLASNKMVL
jgi:hypothetical protein